MGDAYDDYERRYFREFDEIVRNTDKHAPKIPVITARRLVDQIICTGWIGDKTPQLYRSVKGAWFSKEGGAHWEFPLDVPTCNRLQEVFGGSIEFDQNLTKWLAKQTKETPDA